MADKPEIQAVKDMYAALSKDPHWKEMVIESIRNWAEKDAEKDAKEKDPEYSWPGFKYFFEEYLDGDDFQYLESHRRRYNQKTRDALDAVRDIFDNGDTGGGFIKALSDGFMDLLKKVPGEKKAEDEYEEVWKDVMDFEKGKTASSDATLRSHLVKLAHQHPELRKHLIPLLNKAGGDAALSNAVEALSRAYAQERSVSSKTPIGQWHKGEHKQIWGAVDKAFLNVLRIAKTLNLSRSALAVIQEFVDDHKSMGGSTNPQALVDHLQGSREDVYLTRAGLEPGLAR